MKKITLFVTLLLLGVSLQAASNYCIQVSTANQSELHTIVAKASSSNYAGFNDVRVETRGHYLVFRIGDYKSYQDAKNALARVQEVAKDAYIRKCDFQKDKAVFIVNEKQKGSKEIEVKEDTTLLKRSTPKINNKFNIDERFLP